MRKAPLRVLVVDDEPLICWSLAGTLVDIRSSVVARSRTNASCAIP